MRSMALVAAAVLSASALAFACGMDSSASGFDASGRGGGDAGAAPSDNVGGSSGNPAQLVPTDNGVILVHAAGTQSFRLCFENMLDAQPQPDSKTMPESNVVGVEVGSAVRIAPLKAGPVGRVFLFDEPLIRSTYPPGGGDGPSCNALLGGPLGNFATTLGTIDEKDPNPDLSKDVHVIAVKGCRGNSPVRTYSTAECGASWDASKGNLSFVHMKLNGFARNGKTVLPTQIIHLSQPLDSAAAGKKLTVSFGEVGSDTGRIDFTSAPTLFGDPAPAPPMTLAYTPDDVASYAKLGFRVSIDSSKVLDTTLANVQKLSAPDDVPTSYYSAASNYVLLLLGDPAPKVTDGGTAIDPDERRNLHLLAIPVIEPKPDAGADGGDGG